MTWSPAALGCHSYFADQEYRQLKSQGAELRSDISDQPWRMREFGGRTVDGHRIMIGHALPD